MRERVIEILRRSGGLRAREIAQILRVERRDVNRILYYNNSGTFQRDDNYRWYLITDPNRIKMTIESDVIDAIRAINTIHEIINLIIENDDSVFYPSTNPLAKFENYDEVLEDVDYHIFSFCIDIYVGMDEDEIYVDDEDFDEIDVRLGNILSMHTYEEDFKGFCSGFCTRDKEIPDFIYGVIKYDQRNQTKFGELVLRCFEIIGLCFVKAFHTGKNIKSTQMQFTGYIEEMREHMDLIICEIEDEFDFESVDEDDDEEYDFDSNEVIPQPNSIFDHERRTATSSPIKCSVCGAYSHIDLITIIDGNVCCQKCSSVSYSLNKETKKLDIEETCNNCRLRKDYSCSNAKLNFVCNRYEYSK